MCGCVLCLVLVVLFNNLCPSSFAILVMGKRELVALLKRSSCLVTFRVLWLFTAVPWVGLRCVIVVFPIIFMFFTKWIDFVYIFMVFPDAIYQGG